MFDMSTAWSANFSVSEVSNGLGPHLNVEMSILPYLLSLSVDWGTPVIFEAL